MVTTLAGFKDSVERCSGSWSLSASTPNPMTLETLSELKSVALTTSTKDTLTEFGFYTSRSWNPNYSALLPFNQLKTIVILSSCKGGCSSRIDDDIITNMAQAMPKLEILLLDYPPCGTPTGITVNGFIALARLCPRLSKLSVHFRATTLVEAANSATAWSPPNCKPVIRLEDCVLTSLMVGMTPIPARRSKLAVAHILLQIFPRILNIEYDRYEDVGWRAAAEIIKNFRRIGNFVHHTGKAYPTCI